MTEAFKPLGERSRWRMIYDLFRAAEIGETVTYETMAEALGLDAKRAKHEIQMAARRAALELERVDKRAVDAVRNVGYRIVQHAEVLGLTRRRNRKAGRQITRGEITANAVDLNEVDDDVKRGLALMLRGFHAQGEINRAMGARLHRAEEIMTGLGERVESVEERLKRLEG